MAPFSYFFLLSLLLLLPPSLTFALEQNTIQHIPKPVPLQPPHPRSYKFDYYRFVIQWAVAECNNPYKVCNNTEPLPSDFKIHGIWPAPPPEDLDSKQFGKKFEATDREFLKLTPQLRIDWSDVEHYKQGSGFGFDLLFWSKEWDKHGRLSNLKQPEYFQMGPDLKQKMPTLIEELRQKGVGPGSNQADYKRMRKVAGEFLKESTSDPPPFPAVFCNSAVVSKIHRTTKQQIWELRFNVTRDGKHLQPTSGGNCNHRPVYLTTFSRKFED